MVGEPLRVVDGEFLDWKNAPDIIKRNGKYFAKTSVLGIYLECTVEPEPTEDQWEAGEEC